MKMADSEKTEEFVDADSLPECPSKAEPTATAARGAELDEALKTETTTTSSPPGEKETVDSPQQMEGEPGLLAMPCLMKELRRDSPEPASTGSDKPATGGRAYESDSSNPCMLSPSSSGHLADSDTLSSGEDATEAAAGCSGQGKGAGPEGGAEMATATGGQAVAAAASGGGRKSRRSRSESDASTPNMMGAKKNRCQLASVVVPGGTGPENKQTNGRLSKVKGHRSQKHKDRMRLLRQKREAAARKKYNLLQDSSTSDSDLTCDSSSSSTDEEEEEGTGGKTISTDIPGHIEAKPSKHKGQINLASSDSEVEIVGVQENTRCGHPRGGVIQSLSSWKPNSVEPFSSMRQGQLWTTLSPQPNWVTPPEVVDLTLDEDTRHKYLL